MVFRADSLDASDMVLDFKAVKQMMGEFLQQFDHSLCMNTEDPNYRTFLAAYGDRIIPFDREDPTSEVMARTIFTYARKALEKAKKTFTEYPVRDCVTLERVRVWETSSSWAEYGEREKPGIPAPVIMPDPLLKRVYASSCAYSSCAHRWRNTHP